MTPRPPHDDDPTEQLVRVRERRYRDELSDTLEWEPGPAAGNPAPAAKRRRFVGRWVVAAAVLVVLASAGLLAHRVIGEASAGRPSSSATTPAPAATPSTISAVTAGPSGAATEATDPSGAATAADPGSGPAGPPAPAGQLPGQGHPTEAGPAGAGPAGAAPPKGNQPPKKPGPGPR